jgi:hypothetical protein
MNIAFRYASAIGTGTTSGRYPKVIGGAELAAF